MVKRGAGGEVLYVNNWYTAGLGRNSKHVFAGATRLSTKLESFPAGQGYGTGAKNLAEVAQYFYHPDHLGSTSYITEVNGEVYEHIEYFPFGESWVDEVNPGPTRQIPYRFTGKEFDPETKLYYYGARYYDPRTSVWQSPDPALGTYLDQTKPVHNYPGMSTDWRANLMGSGQGGVFNPRNLNGFGYAHQNPVKLTDADGKVVFIPVVLGVLYVADKAYAAYEAYKDYEAVQSGEKTITEVAGERATEQAAGAALGAAGRWSVKGFKYARGLLRAEREATRDLARAESRAARGAADCSFDPSTLVVTKDGLKRIDQIDVNELVLARNEKTGETGWRQVEDRMLGRHKETVHLIVREEGGKTDEKIVTSINHPFFVEGKGWVDAAKLKAGDRISTSKAGGAARVVRVTVKPKPLLSYNLSVNEDHTFFVGQTGVLVHNGPCDRRVTLRKGTREEIERNQLRNERGELIDPNTKEPLKPGEIDVGHRPGQEWRRRKQMHEERGSTRKEVIETENDPNLYQLEARGPNRSHRHEQKD